jgi:RNA polymerase sigma factor (sigma-70 family)
MFSTPGSPAQLAREIVNASKPLQWLAVRSGTAFRPADLRAESRAMTSARGDASAAARLAADESRFADADAARQEGRARLDDLYREHSAAMVRRLTRETGCRDTAVEIAQEAFLRLVRMGPARLLGIEQAEAYLRRVTTNLLYDWGLAHASGQHSAMDLEIVSSGLVDQVAVLEARDTLRRLELAMGKLKPKTRAIFLAHRLDGLSYCEIAERTGLSIKGVEKQMSKAIAKIDRLLDRA